MRNTLSEDQYYRPNGPGDSSPGLRPKADALGRKAPPSLRPERSREPGSTTRGRESSRGPFRPQHFRHLSTQGIGLRPQPWAPFSRPVGPNAEPEADDAAPGMRAFQTPSERGRSRNEVRTLRGIETIKRDKPSSDRGSMVAKKGVWKAGPHCRDARVGRLRGGEGHPMNHIVSAGRLSCRRRYRHRRDARPGRLYGGAPTDSIARVFTLRKGVIICCRLPPS